MKYILIAEQRCGCDYTIGCGIRVTELKATDRLAAIAEAVDFIGDDWPYSRHNGFSIEKARLLTVVDETNLAATLDAAAIERGAAKYESRRLAREAKDKADYERLKKQFEGGA